VQSRDVTRCWLYRSKPVAQTNWSTEKDLNQYAFITLEPPSTDPAKTPEPIFLRLQVNPTGPRCEDAVVTLQDLDLDAVSGKSEFLSTTFPRLNRPVDHPDGRFGNLTAAWAYECHLGAGTDSDPGSISYPDSDSSRTLLISISSIDGVVVNSDIDLAVRFRQGPKPEILNVSGAKYQLYSAKDKYNGENSSPRLITGADYPAPSGKPVSSPLRRHPREFYSEAGLDLKMAVAEQRTKMRMIMMAMTGNRQYLSGQSSLPPSRATLSKNAEEVQAEMVGFEEEYPASWRRKPVSPDGTSDEFREEVGEHEAHVPAHREGQREHVLAGVHSGLRPATTIASDGSTVAAAAATSAAAVVAQVSSLKERLSSILGDQDRVTYISVAIIVFIILTLLFVCFLRLRLAMATAKAAHKAELDVTTLGLGDIRGDRHETIFERRARRKNRRNARIEVTRAWLQHLVGSVFRTRSGGKDEEAIGSQRQEQDQLPQPPSYLQHRPPQYSHHQQTPPSDLQFPPLSHQQHSPQYPPHDPPRYRPQRPRRSQPRPQPQKTQSVNWQPSRPDAVEAVEDAPRPPPSPTESTTMEDELAQFRAAASMVDEIIAAQQGRSRSDAPAPRYPAPAPSPSPLPVTSQPTRRPQSRRQSVGARSESEASDCDTLPPYEEFAPEGYTISDGFGFVPGSSAGAPNGSATEEEAPVDAGNSDRLGYDK
jgi:hypothetical protein